MDAARANFLQQFNPFLRPHIVEYAKRLSTSSQARDAVLMFMARKAVCFADSFEILGLSTYDCPVVSDRVLDMDASWLHGKRVVLVDDALVSGTTLHRTIQRLLQLGIPESSITTIVLCVDKKWWSEELVTPESPYLELSDDDTASLCSTIVKAISLVPRPYAVDYPLYRDLRIPESQFHHFLTTPGWVIDDISSPLQKKHSVLSVTFTPENETLARFDQSVGWNFSENALLKVRFYARLSPETRHVYWCSVLPIVALRPLPVQIVENLHHAASQCAQAQRLSITENFEPQYLGPEEAATASINARIRLISYLAAHRLAAHWFTDVSEELTSATRLTEDDRSVHYLFPPHVAQQARAFASQAVPYFALATRYREDPKPILGASAHGVAPNHNDSAVMDTLLAPFLDLYEDKELKARALVKKHGRRVFGVPEWHSIIDRLNSGYTLPEIEGWLSAYAGVVNVSRALSYFLDKSIDKGCLVPITYHKEGLAGRAYRHGEDVKFGMAEEHMCVLMLSALSETYGKKLLPHTLVEKALVLLIRIGLQRGFFNEWDGKLGDHESMGIRFSLHGAVASTGSARLYQQAESFGLTERLENHRFLERSTKTSPWVVANIPKGGCDSADAAQAALVGGLLGNLLASNPDSQKTPLNLDDLTVLATLLYPIDVIGALAAQVDSARRDISFIKTSVLKKMIAKSPVIDPRETLIDLRQSRFTFSANNGVWKYGKYRAGAAWTLVDQLASQLSDPVYRAAWNSFWPTEGRQELAASSTLLQEIAARESVWLYSAKALSGMVSIVLQCEWIESDDGRTLVRTGGLTDARVADLEANFSELSRLAVSDKETNRIVRAGERLVDAIQIGNLDVHRFVEYVSQELDVLDATSADILSEVDSLSATLGRPEDLVYVEQVMHIEARARTIEPSVMWQRIYKQLRNLRALARGKTPNSDGVTIAEIPHDRTPVSRGRWVCSMGVMARAWLVRLAVALTNEFGSSADVRCCIFANLPRSGRIRKPARSSDYVGPIFWSRAEHILSKVLAVRDESEIVCISDESDKLYEGVCVEIERECKALMQMREENRIVEVPFRQNAKIRTYTISRSGVQDHKAWAGKVGVGILTVVPDELRGILGCLERAGGYTEFQGMRTSRYYYQGGVDARDGGRHSIVIGRTYDQGNQSIMTAYQDMMMEFSPDFVVLVGIGGSIHDDVRIGDVVLADEVYFYDRRAEKDYGTEHRLTSYNLVPWVKNEVNHLFDGHGDTIEVPASEGSPAATFRVHFGPIGTGSAVIKHRDAEERKWLKEVNSKTLALDTEAAGIGQQFTEDQLKFGHGPVGYLIVRGISDHADAEKNDDWRKSSAANAFTALSMLLKQLPTEIAASRDRRR